MKKALFISVIVLIAFNLTLQPVVSFSVGGGLEALTLFDSIDFFLPTAFLAYAINNLEIATAFSYRSLDFNYQDNQGDLNLKRYQGFLRYYFDLGLIKPYLGGNFAIVNANLQSVTDELSITGDIEGWATAAIMGFDWSIAADFPVSALFTVGYEYGENQITEHTEIFNNQNNSNIRSEQTQRIFFSTMLRYRF